mgnify:FL=1
MKENILITGAASGLGREVALQFAEKGYYLALVDLNLAALQALQTQLLTKYPDIQVEIESLNITDFDAVSQVFDDLAKRMGGLNTVLANAGIDGGSNVGDADNFSAIHKVIQVNLLGTIACIDKAVSIFKKQGYGHIAVTSSLSAVRGMAGDGYAGYSASKSGVNRYMESLYAELMKAGLHKSITTATLMPGHIATDMVMKNDSFIISVPSAAKAMVSAIEARQRNVVIKGNTWNIIRWLMPILPTKWLLSF